jgi:uncharacterized membrane protein
MMLIGETVLYGSAQIPEQMHDIVSEGLENGGIGLPPIPGLQEAYDQMLEREAAAAVDTEATAETTTEATTEATIAETAEATAETNVAATAEATTEVIGGGSDDIAPTTGLSGATSATLEEIGKEPTLAEKLAADPIANAMAVILLIALFVSGLFILLAVFRSLSGSDQSTIPLFTGKAVWGIMLVAALAALGVAITLVAQETSDSLATPMAWGEALLLIVTVFVIFRAGQLANAAGKPLQLPGWLMPLVVLAGLIVAGYLSYVEVTHTEAVCGAVGNCNTVQESVYARLFGILPIGVFGIMGYIAILGAWLIGLTNKPELTQISHILLLVLSLFGVAFSTYLTFLEPFVIGATCAWCLTSAILMLLMLWMVAKEGLHSLAEMTKQMKLNQQPA